MLKYKKIEELILAAQESGRKISELVLEDQVKALDRSPEDIYAQMEADFDVMCEAIRFGERKEQRSMSGLTGGEGYLMKEYAGKQNSICGSYTAGAMARALAVSGCNASMGKIVATPTAGSCGILPGCLVSLYEEKKIPKKDIIMGMFTAAAFGIVMATQSGIAGAQGGCQAECGSAAGMAAAALSEIMGGTPEMCGHACAMALVNQLGLVCDPVAGLVEIPCIKRNVSGTMIAMSAADMALAGIKAYIPVDECIMAMKEVGDSMPAALKETAIGGLAGTPTGKRLKEQVFGKEENK